MHEPAISVMNQTVYIIIPPVIPAVIFLSHFFSLLKCVLVCIFKCIFVFPLQSMFRKRWKKLFLSEGSVMLLQVKVMLEYNVLNSMFSLFSVR